MEFHTPELRSSYSKILDSILDNLINLKTKLKSQKFKSDQEMKLNLAESEASFLKSLNQKISTLISNDSQLLYDMHNLSLMSNSNCHSSAEQILKSYRKLIEFNLEMIKSFQIYDSNIIGTMPSLNRKKEQIEIDVLNENVIRVSFNGLNADKALDMDESQFIEQAIISWQNVLKDNREPTPNEFLALFLAYSLIEKNTVANCHLNKFFHSMSTPGFRQYTQTYMSLTDPGPGHIHGTVNKLRWMNRGVIMHVEHLERPRHEDRTQIESYRIPSVRKFVFIRLAVANVAPTTFYIGRIVKDSGNFENDCLRISRLFGTTSSHVFSVGAAECKLSMDSLSTYECIKHMRAIMAESIKNPYQILSAAWNLNNKFVDDFNFNEFIESGSLTRLDKPNVINDRFELAKRAILYTKLGGFEKLTWDGASDSYPSKCIVPYQLSLAQALTIVHLAHSAGLLTYFSAGFKFDEIKVAVLAGIDGIGIGGAQILRLMDSDTGYHGPFLQENIDAILYKRDEAAMSIYGKSVKLLCRLDTMYYEGSITSEEDALRETLYQILISRYSKLGDNIKEYDNLLHEDSNDLKEIHEKLSDIIQLKDDNSNRQMMNIYLNKLDRLSRTEDVILIKHADKKDALRVKMNFMNILNKGSEKEAYNFYNSYPLCSYLNKHRKKVQTDLIKFCFEKNHVLN